MMHIDAARGAWIGRIALGPGWAAFAGWAGDNRPHRHPALQLALGDGQPVRAEIAGRHFEVAGLLIGSDVEHRLQPGPVYLLYVERASVAGRHLAADCVQGMRQLSGAECARLRTLFAAPEGNPARIEPLIEMLAPTAAAPRVEKASTQRVREAVLCLPRTPGPAWSLSAMASAAALSPSRFAHVFRELTGMAVRPYLRWLRLARALEAAACGESLTTAAHLAGFADAAHFSRTMRRHFGVAPASVLVALRERYVSSRYVQVASQRCPSHWAQ